MEFRTRSILCAFETIFLVRISTDIFGFVWHWYLILKFEIDIVASFHWTWENSILRSMWETFFYLWFAKNQKTAISLTFEFDHIFLWNKNSNNSERITACRVQNSLKSQIFYTQKQLYLSTFCEFFLIRLCENCFFKKMTDIIHQFNRSH